VRRLLLLAGVVLGCAVAGQSADAAGASEKPAARPFKGFASQEAQPVRAELIARHASIQAGGRTQVGVHFDIEQGWHIYADPPGDAGMPTTITWSSLPGVRFGPLAWPPAESFTDAGDIRTSGYTGVLVLASPVTYTARESVPALPIKASVRWLSCKEICIPGEAELELTLPVTGEPPVLSAHAQLFEQIAE